MLYPHSSHVQKASKAVGRFLNNLILLQGAIGELMVSAGRVLDASKAFASSLADVLTDSVKEAEPKLDKSKLN